ETQPKNGLRGSRTCSSKRKQKGTQYGKQKRDGTHIMQFPSPDRVQVDGQTRAPRQARSLRPSKTTNCALPNDRSGARHLYMPLKTPIALRVDNDVLAWLKGQGPGYQGRINALLRQGDGEQPQGGRIGEIALYTMIAAMTTNELWLWRDVCGNKRR